MAVNVRAQRMWLNDISKPLILMWRELHAGRITLDCAPDHVSREQWRQMKYNRNDSDWLTAFIGHGQSFNARYFEAWVGHTSTLRTKVSIKRKLDLLAGKDIAWTFADYLVMNLDVEQSYVIYCDPPYEGAKRVHNSQGGRDFHFYEYYGWLVGQELVGRRILATGRERPFVGEWICLRDFGDTNPWYSRNGHKGEGPSEKLWIPLSQVGLLDQPK